MAGLFALSIDSKLYQENFLEDLFWGTFYQQHRGEEYSGLSTFGEKIKLRTHRGLFRPAFAKDLKHLEGTEGIGYCGGDEEPVLVDSKLGKLSFCFSGNIRNSSELVEQFKDLGHSFERGGDDIEIIAKLVIQGKNIVDGIEKMTKKIDGAYSLLILSSEGIYAARGPTGHWSLVVGEKDGAIAIASESGGFGNLGFKYCRDLEPGEIVLIKNGCLETKGRIPASKVQICSFAWVYTGFPNAVLEGIPVSQVRKKLGARLAQKDINKGFIPDIVIPVPDSGRFHAIGYHQEFCRQKNKGRVEKVPYYDEILIKYPYGGRSFTPQDEEARKREAQIKLVVSAENYRDKRVVVCDDSIVRGTQTQTDLVPKLKKAGVKEIHFRISSPELRSPCPWGKTTRKKEEILAYRLPSKKERIKFLGIESLEYNSIKDLVEAIGLPLSQELCVDCMSEIP
jgi:amidophosphoribosyltransferase